MYPIVFAVLINIQQDALFLTFPPVSPSRGLRQPRQNGQSRYQWVRVLFHPLT